MRSLRPVSHVLNDHRPIHVPDHDYIKRRRPCGPRGHDQICHGRLHHPCCSPAPSPTTVRHPSTPDSPAGSSHIPILSGVRPSCSSAVAPAEPGRRLPPVETPPSLSDPLAHNPTRPPAPGRPHGRHHRLGTSRAEQACASTCGERVARVPEIVKVKTGQRSMFAQSRTTQLWTCPATTNGSLRA